MIESWTDLRHVDLRGIRLAYRALGPRSGVPAVLLHGLASSSETWRAFAVELAGAGRRVVVPDLRGPGASAHARRYALADFEADTEGLLDYLDVRRVDLVGHSLGGRVASMVAERRPDSVRRLVLEEVRPPSRQGAGRISYPRPTLTDLTRNLRLLSRLRSFDRSMAGPLLRQFRVPDPGWWTALPAITAKTLLIQGGRSGYVPLDCVREINSLIADSSLVTIDSGHRVHSTCAREFRALALPFLTD